MKFKKVIIKPKLRIRQKRRRATVAKNLKPKFRAPKPTFKLPKRWIKL